MTCENLHKLFLYHLSDQYSYSLKRHSQIYPVDQSFPRYTCPLLISLIMSYLSMYAFQHLRHTPKELSNLYVCTYT